MTCLHCYMDHMEFKLKDDMHSSHAHSHVYFFSHRWTQLVLA